MAYTLDELYHAGRRDGLLSVREYENLGEFREQSARELKRPSRHSTLKARKLCHEYFGNLSKLTSEEQQRGAVRNSQILVSDNAAHRLVQDLTNARLLVQSRGESNLPYVEVAHEALLRNWKRLATWIESTQDDLRLLRQVRLAAKEWEDNDRADAFLWPHERLQPVYEMQQNLDVSFDPVVQAFVRPELDRLLVEWASYSSKGHRRLAIIDRLVEIGASAVPTLVRAPPCVNIT